MFYCSYLFRKCTHYFILLPCCVCFSFILRYCSCCILALVFYPCLLGLSIWISTLVVLICVKASLFNLIKKWINKLINSSFVASLFSVWVYFIANMISCVLLFLIWNLLTLNPVEFILSLFYSVFKIEVFHFICCWLESFSFRRTSFELINTIWLK